MRVRWPRTREVAVWFVAAVLGYCLYAERGEAAAIDSAMRRQALDHASAREAIVRATRGRIEDRMRWIEEDLQKCLAAMKQRERR